MNKQSVAKRNTEESEIQSYMDGMMWIIGYLESFRKSIEKNMKKSTRIPLDLKLDLENFGPVEKGTVQLKPLTIFIGPNNSGKSYVSVLVHTILSASISHKSSRPDNIVKILETELPQVTDGTTQISVPPTLINHIRTLYFQSFGDVIGEKLSYNFKLDPHKLIMRGNNSSRITISNINAVDITIKKRVIAESKMMNKKFTINLTDDIPHKIIQETETEVVLNVSPNMKDIIPHVIYTYFESIVPLQLLQSHYLPATRSGITQTYKTLAAGLMSTTPKAGDTFPTHTLTGTIADFVSDMINISDSKGKFAKIAKQMESDLFDGSIDLPRSRDKFPEITYSSNGHRIPLHQASSTISEVAPISMYLKHIAKPGDLMVIEEPEAHMHPANQANMAKSIVRMIRAGLNILITTHSPLLLEKLGHYIVAGMSDVEIRAGHTPYNKDYLLPDEVSPYVFNRSSDGYHIREIDMDDEYGISQEEFTQVLNELNNEAIILQEKLCKKYVDKQG